MIDTHTHLFADEFSDDLSVVIDRAQAAGIGKFILPNIDETSIKPMLNVCSRFPGICFPTIGLHPTSVGADYEEKLQLLKGYLSDSHPFVAVGEVGLDLYWDKTYAKEQEKVLHTQIGWALEYGLPLIIHCREAYSELLTVLKSYNETALSGVFHSFGGSEQDAERLLAYSQFCLGINGTVTFKKCTLPEVLKKVPIDRIVLETDSPYLAPVPFRGRRNESAYVVHVADKLSDVYQRSEAEIATITTQNALKLFRMEA
ncbi:MAG: TatD family hydrolase [Phocaeicola sp.]